MPHTLLPNPQNQADEKKVVNYFRNWAEGPLIFSQSMLSRNLQKWKELEDHVQSHPNALSYKHAQIVTQLDIEKALVLWVHYMEEKGEIINGPMLQEKWACYEKEFDVPEDEHLSGVGWIAPFCKVYNLREFQWHGEAGSVDPQAIEAEWKCVQAILMTFTACDHWNFDETSLFPL